ncbi:Alpha/Beta hydrolase protein [Fennellomyces sp. T-0311]|nr:Alpha/Beta hydrolase protein [Fennellomyces sp. T-0311]
MAPTILPLDPAYAEYCKSAKLLQRVTNGEITILELRDLTDNKLPVETRADIIEEDKTVEYNGKELRLTFFRPTGTENETLPILIFYHGGGFTFGSKLTHIRPVREMCIRNNVLVVFVNYSLAPENKFPIAHEECFDALKWVIENGNSIKADPSKLAVCGDSVGGNLSTSISMMAKKRGLDDAIKAHIMIYPEMTIWPYREVYPSSKVNNTGAYALNTEETAFFDRQYFDDSKECLASLPLNFPLEDLRGLPPALLITTDVDVLCDEGEEYGRRLIAAGVPTTSIRVSGAIHGYLDLAFRTPVYQQTMALITSQLSEAFDRQ